MYIKIDKSMHSFGYLDENSNVLIFFLYKGIIFLWGTMLSVFAIGVYLKISISLLFFPHSPKYLNRLQRKQVKSIKNIPSLQYLHPSFESVLKISLSPRHPLIFCRPSLHKQTSPSAVAYLTAPIFLLPNIALDFEF